MYSIVLVSAGDVEWNLFTEPALASLGACIKRPYELITVDNGGRGRGLVNTENMLAYSHAVNMGASLAHGEKLLILNNDIQLRGDILDRLDRSPGYYNGPVILEKESVSYLEGWCICINIELWHLLNGFDVGYLNSWEDVDLAWRLNRLGITPVQVDLPIKHIWGATRSRYPNSNQWDEENRQRLLSRIRETKIFFLGSQMHYDKTNYPSS